MTIRQLPRIECGHDSSITVGAGDVGSSRVDFAEPFRTPPEVIVGYSGAAGSATYGSTLCGARNITETGFELTFCNDTSASKNPRINWVAIGT